MGLQARLWYEERRFQEAKAGALRAADIYQGIGATMDEEDCKAILQKIEKEMKKPSTSSELPEAVLLPVPANSPFSARDRALSQTYLSLSN